MSLSRRNGPKPGDTEHVLIRRCMAFVLKSLSNPELSRDDLLKESKVKSRQDSSAKSVFEKYNGITEGPGPPDDKVEKFSGHEVFIDLVRRNRDCYWNPILVESVNDLEYRGYVAPSTLLLSGTEYALEAMRSAWSRRLLRPPCGYEVVVVGDVDPVRMNIVPQTQFAPLPEALCKVVYDLNVEGTVATMPVIGDRLKSTFSEILLPEENVLYRTLGSLIRERKLYHTGSGYSVVTPETFRLLAMSPPVERQMLLTNEEAIVRLHGTSTMEGRSACTQTNQRGYTLTSWSSAERILSPTMTQTTGKLKRCHSLKLLRGRDKDKLSRTNSFKATRASPIRMREVKSDAENVDPNKKEKSSVFSKLFRRGRGEKKSSPKSASISSQFPPRDKSDPDFVFYNSRATQTLDNESRSPSKYSKSRASSLNRMNSKERHSQFVTSTPVTPKSSQRCNYQQFTDAYHYRSSSVPRKSSPSPKAESSRNTNQHSISNRRPSPKPPSRQRQPPPPPPSNTRVPTGNFSKTRPKYDSVFSPIAKSDELLLRAGDKYGDIRENNYNSWTWRPLSTLNMATKPPATPLSRPNLNGYLSWKIPSSTLSTDTKLGISEPVKPQAIVGLPKRVFPAEVASISPSTTLSTAKPLETKIFTENTTTTSENAPGKGLQVEGAVDVEIRVEPTDADQKKFDFLNTSLNNHAKKNTFKIAASWNQSITNKTVQASPTMGIKKGSQTQTMSAVTNITTSVTHESPREKIKTIELGAPTEVQDSNNVHAKTLKSTTVVDCSGKCTIINELPIRKIPSECDVASSRTKIADAKCDFFSESPNSLEPNGLKEDSGFSSSASTSRPMSVSPC